MLPTPTQIPYKIKGIEEAWAAFFAVAVMCDGDTSLVKSQQFVASVRLLDIYDYPGTLAMTLMEKMAYKAVRYGNKALIDQAVAYIDDDDKATLYCLLVEIIIARGVIHEIGLKVLKELGDVLEIEEPIREGVMKVLLIKNKRNYKDLRGRE